MAAETRPHRPGLRSRPRQKPESRAADGLQDRPIEARGKAERLAPLRLGVVAFSATGDVEMGDFDENPTVLFKSGQAAPRRGPARG